MKQSFAVLLLCAVCVGCSKPNPLHDSMEEMGDSFKTMRSAEDLTVIEQQLSAFKVAAATAAEQKVKPEHQATFDQGIEKINSLISKTESAIKAGDVQKAKAHINELGDARKKYHDELGVKKK